MFDNVHDLFAHREEPKVPSPQRKEPSMRDWTGSRIQQDALTVPCRFCGSAPGERCVRDGHPLQAFPAHSGRINDATKAKEQQ